MKNNAENRFTQKQREILKIMKKRTAAVTVIAAAVAATAVAGALSLRSGDRELTADPISAADCERSVKTVMPPRQYDVKITVDGKTLGVRCSGTVSDALAAADVTVYDDDLINIGLNEPLNNSTDIVVNRVDIVEEVEVRTIEYATRYREDDDYLVGYSETVVDGEEGEIETTTRSVYVDGELVSTAVIDEDVTEPVDEIVIVGTKEEEPEPEPEPVYYEPAPSAQTEYVDTDPSGVPWDYSYVLTGSSCAYTAAPGALTSTGATAAVGLVAVDPDVIPYGTEMYITSADGSKVYGYAVAADTGGAVCNGTIIVDLFMNSESECYAWGRRDVNIYVLS